MIAVGLTGGIGSGKSTVSGHLAERGAVVIDADAIVKELQQPGQPVLAAMVERFGDGILAEDGSLNRPAVAEIVFGDADALKDLNGIVHPAVNTEIRRRIEDAAAVDGSIVVLDIPLLAEAVQAGRATYPLSGMLVVDVPVETQVERLVAHRGFDAEDARRRIDAQISREDRLALADRVVDNSGTPAQLADGVGELWQWVTGLDPVELPAAQGDAP